MNKAKCDDALQWCAQVHTGQQTNGSLEEIEEQTVLFVCLKIKSK